MKIEIERDVLQQALELAQAFARGHDDGWQSAMGHQAAHCKPYGYLYEGIAEHTRGKTLFKKIPETHLETRWWREVGPIYTSPQPAQLTAQEPLTDERLNEIESEILIKGGSYQDVLRAVADEALHAPQLPQQGWCSGCNPDNCQGCGGAPGGFHGITKGT